MIHAYLGAGKLIVQATYPNFYNEAYIKPSLWLEKNIALKLHPNLVYACFKAAYVADLLFGALIYLFSFTKIASFLAKRVFSVSNPSETDWQIAPHLLSASISRLNHPYPFDYIRDLNHSFMRGEIPNINADKRLLRKIGLHIQGRSSVMLVGEPGCGKTSTVYSFVKYLESPDCFEGLKGKRVYHLDLDSLLSDPGTFIGKIITVLSRIQQDIDAVLFIDEAHRLGDRVYGVKISDILKPFIDKSCLVVIGVTTNRESKELFQDEAIKRRFAQIPIFSSSGDTVFEQVQTKFILHKKLMVDDEAIRYAIEKAPVHFENEAEPDRSIRVLEYALKNKSLEMDDTPISKRDIIAAENLHLFDKINSL